MSLVNLNPEKLKFWLCRFVTEVRKKDGTPYPPWSIHLILAGLQRIVFIVIFIEHVIQCIVNFGVRGMALRSIIRLPSVKNRNCGTLACFQ